MPTSGVLRPLLPALTDKSAAAPARLREVWRPGRKGAGFRLDNAGPGSRWPELVLLYNADSRPHTAVLPAGRWQVLADGEDSRLWQTEEPVAASGQAVLPAGSALVLGRADPIA